MDTSLKKRKMSTRTQKKKKSNKWEFFLKKMWRKK